MYIYIYIYIQIKDFDKSGTMISFMKHYIVFTWLYAKMGARSGAVD